jgi:hypothetical protein
MTHPNLPPGVTDEDTDGDETEEYSTEMEEDISGASTDDR